jgi:hypothetical protein
VHLEQRAGRAATGGYSGGGCRGLLSLDWDRRRRHAGLSRSKSLFVIARNSSFIYKGKAVDIKQVGRELGVRYVLEGSVRKAGSRVRITGQLVNAETANHIWADRYDSTLEDIFDLQDRVTTSVIGAIAPQLERAEIARAQTDREPASVRLLSSRPGKFLSLYTRSEYRGA